MIVGLLFSVNMTRGAFSVTVGDAYDFDVVAANQSVTVGTDSGSGSGYEVGGLQFAEGTSVNANVTAVGSDVDYNLTAGAGTEALTSDGIDLLFSGFLQLLMPIAYIYEFCSTDYFNQTRADVSPGLLMFTPFVESDFNWTVFAEMADDTHAEATTNATQTMLADADYTEDTTSFTFEYYLGGIMDGNFTDASGIYFLDLDLEHHYQFSFLKTGVMQGMRMEFSFTGTSNGTDIDVSLNWQMELAGYNLPGYAIGGGWTWPFPAFGIIAAFTALGTIAVLVIKRRK